ncbi:PfpI family intracellular peptidase [Endogone sp. FLAS-F59071]|nr:PfpI family intracellular peptidase [Endogone sp. FLAS-F59071]|eukprot:RUS21634.1 PfpI family intracellular peptidase [Endogone sp. FLAS-F59071]
MASSKKLLEIVGDYVEDYELYAPIQALEMLGYEVHVVCPDRKAGDVIQTAIHEIIDGQQTYSERAGHKFTVNYSWSDIKVDNYEGLIVPGGRCPEYLRYNKDVLKLVGEFFTKDKPVAAICHGLQILAAAGVLKGRSVSCFPMCELDIKAGGGNYVEYEAFSKNAYVDGKLVTAPAYPAIGVWLREFIKVLGVKVQI